MADRMLRVSDLSGQVAQHRVAWSVGTKKYVLDLTDDELAQFNEVLKPYVDASRPGPRKPRKKTAKTAG